MDDGSALAAGLSGTFFPFFLSMFSLATQREDRSAFDSESRTV